MTSRVFSLSTRSIWAQSTIQGVQSRRLQSDIQKRWNSHVVKNDRPFRMAVIGSGPAGFYTAYRVMALIPNAIVDMYESLPVPFGLVRFGVAPDHPEVKNCQDKFAEIANSPKFNFIGNVEVGKTLPLSKFQDHYSAIVFAYGASRDRKLGIQGEDDYAGIYSARDFVGWYNGYPTHSHLNPDLTASDTAVIIGQGNVALDVARTLLTDVNLLRKTDITDIALAGLAKSKIRRVHIIGRRGPMQAAYTIKEVREMMKLPAVGFHGVEPSLLPSDTLTLRRTAKRMVSLLKSGSPERPDSTPKAWSFDSMLSPVKFLGDKESGHLSKIQLSRNEYVEPTERYDASARIRPQANSDLVNIATGLVFRSIGYRSEALHGMQEAGIHFDSKKGIVLNDGEGRAIQDLASDSQSENQASRTRILPGIYCAGWVKRGPAGVIANTMEDAFATANAIASDWNRDISLAGDPSGWETLRREPEVGRLATTSWSDWLKIDSAERARGQAVGKVREKFLTVQEMMSALG